MTFTFLANYFVESSTFLDGTCITYTAMKSDGTPLPAWLTFNPKTRKFTGTPTGLDRGTLIIKVVAKNNL